MNPDSKTGVTTYYNLLQEYMKNFKIIILTPDDAPWVIKKAASAYFLIFTFLFPGKWPFIENKYFIFLLKFALKKNIHYKKNIVFHAQDPVASYSIRRLFKTSPIITTCHYNDDPISEFRILYNITQSGIRRLQKEFKFFFNTSNHFICVSRYVAEKSNFLMPAETGVSIIHNTVDFKKIYAERMQKTNNKIIITNCGTLESRKNQILLIELAKDLIDSNFNNFEIWLIGSGPNFNLYKSQIQEYNLNEYVKLLGWQSSPWQIISKSHIYIHTAINESFGYTLLEAIAAGAYAIGIDAGGVREVLYEDALFPLNEARKRLHEYIINENFKEIEAKSLSQYEIISKKFDISRWVEKHSTLYKHYGLLNQ